MFARFARGAALIAMSTVSCADCKDKPTDVAADAASAQPSGTTSAAPTAPPTAAPSLTAAAAGDASPTAELVDAGPSACALGWGPAEQAFTGQGALVATAAGFDVVYHVDGVPTVRHYDAPKILPGTVLPLDGAIPSDKPRATEPPCAAAGPYAFCMDRAGNVHRAPRAGGPASVVARAKPGTRLTAASTGKETLVGYLVERTTTEGVVTEAWIVGDTAPVTRISEDGTGATHVSLAFSGGDQIAAFYINGRRGMAPIDGVMLTAASGHFALGKDDVLFVAGGAETNTAGALLTRPGGVAVAYVPIAHDVGFGLLSVHVDGPPNAARDVAWSDYLNGLDPAPVAATQEVPGLPTGPGYVARIRPLAAKFGSPRVLELGRAAGPEGFEPLGIVPTHGSARDVAMVRDATGALVLLYVDDAGTWIERRVCK